MDAPDSPDLADLARRGEHRRIADILVDAERARGVHDLDALRTEPVDEIRRAAELQVVVEPLPDDDCPVAGYYDHTSATIILHPSLTLARDRFTVLHELGHHVQRRVSQWVDLASSASGDAACSRLQPGGSERPAYMTTTRL